MAEESLDKAEKAHLEEIRIVNVNNENQKSISIRLNAEMTQLRQKSKKDLNHATNKLKSEIKGWKKDLGRERKEKKKLEKKLSKYTKVDEKTLSLLYRQNPMSAFK